MEDLGIVIDGDSPEPAYRQVYLQIRTQIADGRIHSGALLPKIRDLATSLGIARNTVETAYKQLALEGLAQGKRGVGYIVEDLNLEILREAAHGAKLNKNIDLSQHPVSPLGDDFGCPYDFSYGNRSVRDLPIDGWRACANEALGADGLQGSAIYIDPFGLKGLREQLALHIAETRDVVCSPDQIVLQPGTQIALGNIALLFKPEQRRFAIEDPGYNMATRAFEQHGCDIVPIPVHRSADVALEALRSSEATCFFCTPSNQFPLGFITPLASRLKIIEWARETDSYIIEDDYCCEYRYDASFQIPSMQSLDHDRVIYMGTLSKVLSPAIRMSYLVLPPALLARWNEVNAGAFCPLPWLDQRILELFMKKGLWRRYVRSTVNAYSKRHDALIRAIGEYLGERVQVRGANAGLHILLGDRRNRNQHELIELARNNGVRVYETDHYWTSSHHPMENYVLVGFSAFDEKRIDEGIRRLGLAWYG